MKIWIDVDDTLVVWSDERGTLEAPNPLGYNATQWEWNEQLVRAVDAAPDEVVAIWSGGGAQYAGTWANRLVAYLGDSARDWTVAGKDPSLLQPGDIMVDDQPLEFKVPRVPVLTPEQFVAVAGLTAT